MTISTLPARSNLIAAAVETAAGLDRTVQVVQGGDAPVRTTGATLKGLSGLLRCLSDEVSSCGGADCMGRKIEGLRLWVTMDQFNAVEAEAKALREERDRLTAALRQIADGTAIDVQDRFFGDAEGAMRSVRTFAMAAINA